MAEQRDLVPPLLQHQGITGKLQRVAQALLAHQQQRPPRCDRALQRGPEALAEQGVMAGFAFKAMAIQLPALVPVPQQQQVLGEVVARCHGRGSGVWQGQAVPVGTHRRGDAALLVQAKAKVVPADRLLWRQLQALGQQPPRQGRVTGQQSPTLVQPVVSAPAACHGLIIVDAERCALPPVGS